MKNDHAKCPGGGRHTFSWGACWKCGMTKREHDASKKEALRNYAKTHPRHPKGAAAA
jgi:hypothetical protein